MKLLTIQRAVARAVMQPLAPSERMQRTAPGGGCMSAYAARYIKSNDRLTSSERLEIYNRQYWFRVLWSMIEDFPGLRAILGERRFDDMCCAYLTECPSRSFTLRNLGAPLEAWLRRNAKWIRGRETLALDMVRLEWADIEAFDGEEKPALAPEDLHGSSVANLTLRLQPHIQLLALSYPVDDLLLEVRKDDAASDFASNTLADNRKTVRVRAVPALHPKQVFLAIHRMDFSVYFRRVEHEEFALLSALRGGKTMERAIDLAFQRSSIPEFDRAGYVRHCFQTWATLGWFCRPQENVRGENAARKSKNLDHE
jgi:Putative DNA-binding domain